MLYLIQSTSSSLVEIANIEAEEFKHNIYFSQVYFISPAPAYLNEFNFWQYNIKVIEQSDGGKELQIEKKPAPFSEQKREKLKEARKYGNSPAVDANLYRGEPLVIRTELRTKLRERFATLKANNQSTTTIVFGKLTITALISQLEEALTKIAYRAIQNYDNLQNHLSAIEKLTTTEALNEYDFRTGYQLPLNLDELLSLST